MEATPLYQVPKALYGLTPDSLSNSFPNPGAAPHRCTPLNRLLTHHPHWAAFFMHCTALALLIPSPGLNVTSWRHASFFLKLSPVSYR